MVKEARLIYTTDTDNEDIRFWKGKTFEEKLAAVQILREQYIQLFNKQDEYYESRKSLRRVYRIIK